MTSCEVTIFVFPTGIHIGVSKPFRYRFSGRASKRVVECSSPSRSHVLTRPREHPETVVYLLEKRTGRPRKFPLQKTRQLRSLRSFE